MSILSSGETKIVSQPGYVFTETSASFSSGGIGSSISTSLSGRNTLLSDEDDYLGEDDAEIVTSGRPES